MRMHAQDVSMVSHLGNLILWDPRPSSHQREDECGLGFQAGVCPLVVLFPHRDRAVLPR